MKHTILKFCLLSVLLSLVFGCEKPVSGGDDPSNDKQGLLSGVEISVNVDKVTATTASIGYSVDLGDAANMPIDVKIRYSIAESLSGPSSVVKTLDKAASSVVLTGLQLDRQYFYEVFISLYGTEYNAEKGSFTTSAVSVTMAQPQEKDGGLVLSGTVQGADQADWDDLDAYVYFYESEYPEETQQRFELQVDNSNAFELLLPRVAIDTEYGYWWAVKSVDEKSIEGSKLSYRTSNPYVSSKQPSASGTDLSASGTANSYIVSQSGAYKFKMTKGNSQESVGNVNSVKILWESFGTAEYPKPFDLISAAGKDGDYALFEVPQTFKEGNAVIAAYDSQDNILWSWHIWLTSAQMTEITYANEAGIMMDRNLGALSATPNDAKALGLFYQWGRKDPFLGSSSISQPLYAMSTRNLKVVTNTPETATLAYALANPHKFILANEGGDWLASKDNSLWGSIKTIYDPCPAGWRIPEGGYNDGMGEQGLADGIWAKAGIPSKGNYAFADIDSGKSGKVFTSQYCMPDTWYPAAGSIKATTGELFDLGIDGIYMSSTTFGDSDPCFTGLIIQYHPHQKIHYINCGGEKMHRAGGFSVRCCKE